jgi:hypothetical protein
MRGRLGRAVVVTKLAVGLTLLLPAMLALASSRPLPPSGIHAISPVPLVPVAPAPVTSLAPDATLYNQLVQTQQSNGSQAAASAMTQSAGVDGPGVLARANGESSGGTLFATGQACLTFDNQAKWNGRIHYAAYGNWGTFSVNDGGFYKPEHVRFDMERTVGPGDRHGGAFSLKIAGDQPYAAGLVSPVLNAPPGAVVQVRVHYLLFNQSGVRVGEQTVNDWVSLGLKPDAHGGEAFYINGYTRGQWSSLTNSVVVGESGQYLVLIQAESPAALNSNIYFDDIEIWVDGMPLSQCE